MPRRNQPSRRCDNCGRSYLRRNLTEAWTVRNPGHRGGWMKQIQKICMNCQTITASKRVMLVASVNVVSQHQQKRRSHG